MAYALAPQINSRPWSFGFVTVHASSLCLSRSLNFNKFRRDILYSSVGKLTRATGEPSFRRVADEEEEEEEDEDDEDDDDVFQVLTSITSNYNDIVIVDTPKSRVLLLDSSRTTARILPYLQFYPLKGNS